MDDDKLLQDFFSTNKVEIEDDGFAERVMRRMPKMRPIWLSILQGVVLTALAAAAFIYFDGWGLLCGRAVQVAEKVVSLQYTGINPLTWVVLVVLTAWLCADKIKSLA